MRKLILILFLFISFVSKAQVYQEMPQYGYRANRMIFDSTLSIPSTCGVPTLRSNITKKAAIAFDSCNNRFYQYNPKTLTWSVISGTSIDTTSLSNRINAKADTSALNLKLNISDTANKWVNNIIRTPGKDSIIFYIGSTRYAIKDSVGTNPPASGYYGAFQDNTIQTAAAINTPYAMKFGVTDLSNAVSIVSDGSNLTRITIANTGIYNIQFSAQFDRTNSGTDVVDIWLRKNGIDVAGTGGKIVLTGGAVASAIIATWNYVLDVTAGDYYQLMWSTPDTHVRLLYEAAQTSPFVHPIIPSTILTVTQQSGIMAGTGITAINSLTGAAQTVTTGTSGTDFAVSSTGTTHTLNLPTASATNRGALSSANWTTFNNKLGASDTVSLSNRINLKLNISDTASMLSPYLRKIDTTNKFVNNISRIAGKDSIIFYIGSTRYAIKDSTGAGSSYTFSTGLTNSSGTVTSNLSTGVSGGQSVVGGTAASNSLTLSSTTNATKGKILFGTSAYDEVNNRLGIGTASPTYRTEILGSMGITRSDNSSIGTLHIINTSTTGANNIRLGQDTTSNTLGFGWYPSGASAYRGLQPKTAYMYTLGGAYGLAFNTFNTSQPIIFCTDDWNERMRVSGTGNFLINTTTDGTYKLDVNGTARVQGALNFNPTNTASGTTGNQTINKASGTVNIAAAGTTVTVTNSLVTASSIVYAVIRTNDATATIKNVVPGAGSFVINLGVAATAETSIGFFVIN